MHDCVLCVKKKSFSCFSHKASWAFSIGVQSCKLRVCCAFVKHFFCLQIDTAEQTKNACVFFKSAVCESAKKEGCCQAFFCKAEELSFVSTACLVSL